MSGANSCTAKQATPTPRPQDMCSEAPRQEFILFSTDVPVTRMVFSYEGDAQRAAEGIARSNRGARIGIAKVVAIVHEPLMTLQWTDERIAGSGQDHSGILSLGGQNSPADTQKYR